jgi:hypothetical protein
MGRWESEKSPFTFQQVLDATLARLRETADLKWATKFHIEGDVWQAIRPDDTKWPPSAFGGQVARALDKLMDTHADEFVKIKKGDRYPDFVEEGDGQWSEDNKTTDPLFAGRAFHKRALAARAPWDAEKQRRRDRATDLKDRATALGVESLFSTRWGSREGGGSFPNGHVTINWDDFEKLIESAEKWQ